MLAAAHGIANLLAPLSGAQRQAACELATRWLADPVREPVPPPAWAMRRILRALAANPVGLAPRKIERVAGLRTNSRSFKDSITELLASGQIRRDGNSSSRRYYLGETP